jgi:hypothetical protein
MCLLRGLLLPAHRFLDAARADSPARSFSVLLHLLLSPSCSGNNKTVDVVYAIGMCLDVRREQKKCGECENSAVHYMSGDGRRWLHMDSDVDILVIRVTNGGETCFSCRQKGCSSTGAASAQVRASRKRKISSGYVSRRIFLMFFGSNRVWRMFLGWG